MRGALLAVVLALGWVAHASAQTVTIRSGEHGAFTRLVFPIDPGTTWRLEKADNAVNVILPERNTRFDLSSVFRRIDRARLADISQDGPGAPLRLDLACACQVDAFVERSRYLVLDIRPDTSPRLPDILDILPRRETGFTFQLDPDRTPPPRLTAAQVAPSMPAPLVPPSLEPSVASPGADPLSRALETHLARKQDGGSALQANLASAEDRLLKEIARAAGQGLVEPRRLVPAPPVGVEPQEEAQTAPVPAAISGGSPPQVSLNATTAVERAAWARMGQSEGVKTQAVCIADEELEIANWGDGRPFHLQVGAGRAALYGEFDRINEEATRALARTYLHVGFGAEARDVLTLLAEPTGVLEGLASIIDAPGAQIPEAFVGQTHCDGPAALWSYLSMTVETAAQGEVNARAILTAFRALPPPLRAHLGPDVSRRFAAAGDEEAAAMILRSAERSSADVDGEMLLAQADLATLNGRDDDAEALVAQAAQSDGAAAVEALSKKVLRAFEARSTLSPDVPELLASYLTEHRNGEHGRDLRHSLAVANALTGDFDAAATEIATIATRDGNAAAREAGGKVLWLATERASDVDFLRLAIGARDMATDDLALQTAIARRLVALGLPDPADEMLAEGAYGGLEAERRLLRARVALLRDLPRRALLELLGDTSDPALELRALAHARLAEHEVASKYFRDAANHTNAERELWLAEDWAGLQALVEPGPYGQSVRALMATADTPDIGEERGPLSHGHALLRNSAQTREIVEQMMRLPGNERTIAEPGT
jgi:hypothetical protein